MKIRYLLTTSIVAILISSCSDNNNSHIDVEEFEGVARIYASFLCGEIFHSFGNLNSEGMCPYSWQNEDEIGVFPIGEKRIIAPTSNVKFKYESIIENNEASFIGTDKILNYENIWAYYPWSKNTVVEMIDNNYMIPVYINAIQRYNFSNILENTLDGMPGGSFSEGEVPAVAWAGKNITIDNSYTFNLHFNPVAAYLAIPVIGREKIKSVSISVQTGNETIKYVQLAGTFNIDMSAGLLGLGNPGFLSANDEYATIDSPGTIDNGGLITLDCGNGVQLNQENPTWFWFVVPANMPTTNDTQVIIYVNDNPEFIYNFNRTNHEVQIGRNNTIVLTKNNRNEPFVYNDNTEINLELNIPDPNFRSYILKNFDKNNDGIFTMKEAESVLDIECDGLDIKSLEGIHFFSNLETLNCSENPLTTLDVSKCSELKVLYCFYTGLTTLDVSNCTKLNTLGCGYNQLTTLNVTNCIELNNLGCSFNQLTTLDLSNKTKLNQLNCQNNKLISLDISNCISLTSIDCVDNQLTSLDVSDCKELTSLRCFSNQLSILDVSNCKELITIECNLNQLTKLDVCNNLNLAQLNCDNNYLTSLDVSNNTALTSLNFISNKITTIDISKNINLIYLYCDLNQLTTLDVSKCSKLRYLSFNNNQISAIELNNNTSLTTLQCYDNQLTSLDVSKCSKLKYLSFNNNNIFSIDVRNNTALTNLICSDNHLTTLDVNNNVDLIFLSCGNNQLTSLDVSSTKLVESSNSYPLFCSMESLKTLYLKEGWMLNGININRWDNCIYPETKIEYIK